MSEAQKHHHHHHEAHEVSGEANVSVTPGVIHYVEATLVVKLDDNQIPHFLKPHDEQQ